ncbi:hypothetical protein [Flammeovirga sp. EKP202]|uniref:hypothetical protein n=1 Tax=Flammeovirga sp. EKP202 TaxID=2770592 RepID=UPI00165FE4A1|nr:hypothetical protein [Flammeovirga sp. EKP202]MBD0404293.1 hypothetical protein [Flammeovirga sp. EKP202]
MSLWPKFFKLLYKVFFVGSAVLHQKYFIKRHLIPQLKPFFENSDHTLTVVDYNKITRYYGLIVPAILGELICFLREEKMTFEERKYSTYQCSLTGLVDDFFDVQEYTLDEVRKMVSFEKPPNNSSEKLSEFLHRESFKFYSNRNGFLKSLDDVLLVQEDSRQQFQQGLLSREQLLDLTIRKGGDSFLYFIRLYLKKITPQDDEFFYLLGGITQFSNDIFDLYEDLQENVDTLLTTSASIKEVKDLYYSLIRQLFEKSTQTSFHKIETFLEFYSIGVFNRCIICLDQYESLQRASSSGIFQPGLYSRDELICDMEKPSNLLRSLIMDIKKEINYASISSK